MTADLQAALCALSRPIGLGHTLGLLITAVVLGAWMVRDIRRHGC